jgi:hypothetical protein
MKKPAYIFLLLVTTSLIAYTLYYSSSHLPESVDPLLSLTELPQEETLSATTTVPTGTKSAITLTTHTGKTITLSESNPNGESLSTVTITPSNFATNTPIVVETNKLTNSFLADLNNDTFDELILITQAQGSSSYGDALIYTTQNDTELTPVPVQTLTEDDTKKGGLFEGYMGHDTFTVASGTLVREFPTYTATDTNAIPTGKKTRLVYALTITTNKALVTFSKEKTTLSQVATSSPQTATTTLKKK